MQTPLKEMWRTFTGSKPAFASLPPREDMPVTIVIPAHNEEENIEATVRSAVATKDDHLYGHLVREIIVVNDASEDNTASLAEKAGARVVTPPVRCGNKAKALKYGFSFVKTPLVCVQDGDTKYEQEALFKLLSYFNNSRTGAVCASVTTQNTDNLFGAGRAAEYAAGIPLMKGAQSNTGRMIVVSGCFAVYDFEALQGCGGFDENSNAEDMLLTFSLILKSRKRVYCCQDATCEVVDPSRMHTLTHQLIRWMGALHESVVKHRSILHHDLILPGFVAGAYIDALMLPLILSVAVFGLFFPGHVHPALENIVPFTPHLIVGDMILVSLIAIQRGVRQHNVWAIIRGLPVYVFFMRYINLGIFWMTAYEVYIMGKTDRSWVKGR
jgi:cellulose synthase/poly-beta-1,6-N-acetylglucosamine synthase-like glycosyltransferase